MPPAKYYVPCSNPQLYSKPFSPPKVTHLTQPFSIKVNAKKKSDPECNQRASQAARPSPCPPPFLPGKKREADVLASPLRIFCNFGNYLLGVRRLTVG